MGTAKTHVGDRPHLLGCRAVDEALGPQRVTAVLTIAARLLPCARSRDVKDQLVERFKAIGSSSAPSAIFAARAALGTFAVRKSHHDMSTGIYIDSEAIEIVRGTQEKTPVCVVVTRIAIVAEDDVGKRPFDRCGTPVAGIPEVEKTPTRQFTLSRR